MKMKKNPLNVFNNFYYKWYYPQYWHKNIKMFLHSFKAAYQRVTRGFCDRDTFDLDAYYLHIFTDTLNHLANNHWGYPGHGDFDTDEKWTAYLKELAHKFYLANVDNEGYPTPEADKWWEWVQEHPFDKKDPDFADRENPYSESMFQEGIKIDEERDKEMREGMDMLKRVFWCLWD